MPTEQTGQQTGQSNGTPSKAATREQVIADLDRIAQGATESPKREPAAEPAAEEPESEKTQPEADESELDGKEPEPEPEPEAKDDPDLAKRLAIVAKHEKRAKEAAAKERAAIEQERQAVRRERDAIDRELQSVRGEIESFNQLKGRAKYDPAGVLRALGLGEEDLGPAARQLWAHTKENLSDPKNREAAERMMRERESLDRIAKLEKEIEERKKAEQEREQRAYAEQAGNRFLDNVVKTISPEDHPLAKRLADKAPDKARERFAAIAYELAERDGDLPDADDVLAEYEKRRREELEIEGIDWAVKPKPKAKTEPQATTLGNDIGTRTAPSASNGTSKKSLADKKAELEAELRSMDLRGQ